MVRLERRPGCLGRVGCVALTNIGTDEMVMRRSTQSTPRGMTRTEDITPVGRSKGLRAHRSYGE